jgi:chemotaxis protein MotB
MAGGGGAWKVAYADFVTAMMAFFMVMWLVNQAPEVKEAVAGYFQDPWGTSSENAAPASLLPSETGGRFLHQDLRQSPRRGGGEEENVDPQSKSKWAQKRKVHFLQDGDRQTPAVVIKFQEALADLDQQSQDQLNHLIPSLVGKRNKIEIRGHSTRRPLPSESPYQDLWQLCYARCLATMDYLVEHGIEPERARLTQSAAYDPITRRLEATWQRENSRVEVFLLNELAEEPPGTHKARKETESDRKADKPSPVSPAPATAMPLDHDHEPADLPADQRAYGEESPVADDQAEEATPADAH